MSDRAKLEPRQSHEIFHEHNQTIQRYRRELLILNEIAHTLNASVDLAALLQRTLEKVAELLGLETGWVLLFDETSGKPYLAAAQKLPDGFRQQPGRMAGWCFCLESFQNADLADAANVDVITCSRLHKLALAQGDTASLRYHASIPLKIYTGNGLPEEGNSGEQGDGFKRLGMLNLASPEWRELSEEDLGLLHTVGDVLSVAIERTRLHAHRLEAAQMEERTRLAREIHDTIAQDLSAIAFQLEAAEAVLPHQPDLERARKNVSTALNLARKGLEDARRSVLDLRAAPLKGDTLAESLAALATETESPGKLSIGFKAASSAGALPPAIEAGLYRVAQEALKNVQRHAEATQVMMRLEAKRGTVRLTVEDNGRGFDVASVSSADVAGSFGLIGMRERVRLLGGNFDLDSSPGAGTRIVASVPLLGKKSVRATPKRH